MCFEKQNFVYACGTAGTQSGLILLTKLLNVDVKVLGVTFFADKLPASEHIDELAIEAAELLEVDLSISAGG